MAKRVNKRRKRKIEPEHDVCPFCVKGGKVPHYKDFKKLAEFLTDRARIVSSERSGVCSKHQRYLTTQIKRARQLGLLPFAPTV